MVLYPTLGLDQLPAQPLIQISYCNFTCVCLPAQFYLCYIPSFELFFLIIVMCETCQLILFILDLFEIKIKKSKMVLHRDLIHS